MLSGSSPLLAAHMKKKRGLDWLCWQQLCQQISNGLGRGSRWAAARPTPRPVLLLGLYPDMFLPLRSVSSNGLHDRGGSVEGEVTWKYLGAAVLRRGPALGTLHSSGLHHKCISLRRRVWGLPLTPLIHIVTSWIDDTAAWCASLRQEEKAKQRRSVVSWVEMRLQRLFRDNWQNKLAGRVNMLCKTEWHSHSYGSHFIFRPDKVGKQPQGLEACHGRILSVICIRSWVCFARRTLLSLRQTDWTVKAKEVLVAVPQI